MLWGATGLGSYQRSLKMYNSIHLVSFQAMCQNNENIHSTDLGLLPGDHILISTEHRVRLVTQQQYLTDQGASPISRVLGY